MKTETTKQNNNQGVKMPVQFPADEKPTRFGRDSLTKACYGNDRIGSLLSYFIFEAGYEIKRQSLPECCNVVDFTRKLNEILERLQKLNFNLCEKTLIRYLDLLNEWGYVASARYQKTFTVHLEKIQEAINNPPKRAPRPAYDRNRNKKSCKSTTLQHSPEEVKELREKVDTLQQIVDTLQQKVVGLQEFVDRLSTLQHLSLSVGKPDEGHFSAPIDTIDTYRSGVDTGTYGPGQSDNSEKGATAPVVENDAHTPDSLFSEKELPPLDTKPETTEEKPPVSPNGKNPTKPHKPVRNNEKGKAGEKPPAPEKPKTGLDAHTEQERLFWDLWLHADQNKKVPPLYKDSAAPHIRDLAPQITTQQQMDSLVTFSREKTRKKLNLPDLWKIELGNLRNCFPDWDQAQSPGEDPKKEIGKMSQEELRDYALSFPPRLDHHTQAYKDLQRCLDRLLPDNKKEVVRKRFEVQHQTTAIAS